VFAIGERFAHVELGRFRVGNRFGRVPFDLFDQWIGTHEECTVTKFGDLVVQLFG
jgi:hypothetical protein